MKKMSNYSKFVWSIIITFVVFLAFEMLLPQYSTIETIVALVVGFAFFGVFLLNRKNK